jgi:FKBP-type peptidyl-prolyl cis-trans isomerase 2
MQKGDFLMIEYVGRIASTGEVFDLTDEEVARKEGIHDPKAKYGPNLVILGSGMTTPGVEKQLMEMKVGEEREFDVNQEQGFGKRDPQLIKIVSYQKFISQKINPVPGIMVNIDGRHARIQSVSGGRVRIDFNSPLAGKDLHYKLKISSKLTAPQDQSQAFIDYYGINAKSVFSEGKLTVTSDTQLHETIQKVLDREIRKWIKQVKKIEFKSQKVKLPEKEPPKTGQ